MAQMATDSRTTRPLPGGWSDSSDDGGVAAHSATGGFDDSSSSGGEGGWAGGGRRGRSMRDFERIAAENTRRALLENDAQLCEPPSMQQQQGDEEEEEEEKEDACSVDSGGGGCGRQEGEGMRRRRRLRFVPGDPFANEDADVDAWARHFTYLSVIPGGRVGGGGPARGKNGDGISGSSRNNGNDSLLPGTNPPHAASGEMEVEAEEAAEVFASHGVYEEYLAYDRRPPAFDDEDEDDDDNDDEDDDEDESDQRGGSALGGGHGICFDSNRSVEGRGGTGPAGWLGGSSLCATAADATAAPAAAAAAAAEAGLTSIKPASGASVTGAPRKARASRRPDTPQRELRQEIMERLFDELWERITPELTLLLALQQPAAATATPTRPGSGDIVRGAGAGLRHEPRLRDRMEEE